MPPEDRARLKSDQQKIERTLERNRDALHTSRQKSAKFARTLTSSGADVQSARSDLRKAGYLKK
jgi:hypothetical protein